MNPLKELLLENNMQKKRVHGADWSFFARPNHYKESHSSSTSYLSGDVLLAAILILCVGDGENLF